MNFFDLTFWQNFGSNLLATIIGVVIGIPVAFWINRRIEIQTEKEKKQKILVVMLEELEVDLAFIKWWCNIAKERQKIIKIARVPQANELIESTWRAFSDGGELQWIKDPELLKQLSYTYSQITYIKFLSEKYMDVMYNINLTNFFFSYSFILPAGKWMMENMERLEKTVGETIEMIKKNLK